MSVVLTIQVSGNNDPPFSFPIRLEFVVSEDTKVITAMYSEHFHVLLVWIRKCAVGMCNEWVCEMQLYILPHQLQWAIIINLLGLIETSSTHACPIVDHDHGDSDFFKMATNGYLSKSFSIALKVKSTA